MPRARILVVLLAAFAALPLAAQSSLAGIRIYEPHEVEIMPRALNAAALVEALQAGYPAVAAEDGFTGTVRVSLVVDARGVPHRIRPVEPAHPAFDSATVAAAQVLRFTPGAVARRPVAVRVEFPVEWRFVEGPPEDEPEPPPPAPDTAEVPGHEVLPRVADPGAFSWALSREYPRLLRDAGLSGEVRAHLLVDAQGRVEEVIVVRSTHAEFTAATRRLLLRLRFIPAMVDGIPVATWVEVPIQWSVHGGMHGTLRRLDPGQPPFR